MIVDNKEVTTEVVDTEMCSSACDVAMETCSSQSPDTCGDGLPFESYEQPKTRFLCEIVCGYG